MSLKSLLHQTFGFESFKKGQEKIISKVLANKSAIAIFPTGSGKSLCYQLPATLLPGVTLVVSPLLSLMKDQLDFMLKHGIAAARLDSTLEREEYNNILERAKGNLLKILMISVERFKNERFRSQLQLIPISLLVIDEAHCISEWGHNFRPDYMKLPLYQHEFNIPQTLLLTATATKEVVIDMQNKFSIINDDVVITGFYRKNLFLQMSPGDGLKRKQNLLQRIKQDTNKPSIIYVTLQKTAQVVSDYLKAHDINCRHYHAGMNTDERELVQNQFMQGHTTCIVATIAFGMGIDKKDVRRVIHYDLPKSIENYSQEIGRSGRDGQDSLCEVLANDDNINVHENFIYGDTPERQSIAQLLTQIQYTQESFWEIKLISLSNELNIRVLPLKTLLVYLEMEGIIKPKYSYYEEYSFKNIDNCAEIINRFQGERRDFISVLFNNCTVKKTWTYVDIQGILQSYNTDRNRIIMALEYFEEKNILELHSKQAVERFEIKYKTFDITSLVDKMYGLFINREKIEIQRIHNMLNFFAADNCLSKQLAQYFGEQLDFEKCGHCSHCTTGKANLQSFNNLKPIDCFDFDNITNDFIQSIQDKYSTVNLSKFLCGIVVPVFRKNKIRHLSNFSLLQHYPYQQVKKWVEEHD
ncbi:MAG: RecQ family ATP-dependent DNA helicase [Alcanivoracaceae bacterium]|nr:RecQ family ATP-dependent DNA helicase [Alcanivoracaceae bacterium]